MTVARNCINKINNDLTIDDLKTSIKKDIFPNVYKMLQVALTLPVSSSTCERSFSAMRRIKTWSFIETLYALYHQSPKNMNEFNLCAASLESNLLRIALYKHFSNASTDDSRTLKEKSKYIGLKKTLGSVEFVKNLGIMHDALDELADLSNSLQSRNHTLPQANDSILRIVRIFNSMSTNYGQKTEEAIHSCEHLLFKGVPLINLDVLQQTNWPDNCDIQLNTDLNSLLTAIKTIAISSSECESAFSIMNNLVTNKRNPLSSSHISSLMLINCVGPPVQKFKPDSYVLCWIRRGKISAKEECYPKRNNTEVSHNYEHLSNSSDGEMRTQRIAINISEKP
ncbi:hypothetical protein QTP88_006526 [Uroleucon formosanum]